MKRSTICTCSCAKRSSMSSPRRPPWPATCAFSWACSTSVPSWSAWATTPPASPSGPAGLPGSHPRLIPRPPTSPSAAWAGGGNSRATHSPPRPYLARLYRKVFAEQLSALQSDPDHVMPIQQFLNIAHTLERIGDRVTNVAEDIVFLDSGQVVELD